MTESNGWFEVDKSGLAKLLEDRGKSFAVLELIQNSWDADGVTRVTVTLEPHPDMRARWWLRVEDDAPDGFADLTHSYRLFAESEKKADATKRGRFNLGEKLVLAICEVARVVSTTGGVLFDKDGFRIPLDERRPSGSLFSGLLVMTKPEAEAALAKVATLIPPAGIVTTLNGVPLLERQPVRVIEVSRLNTMIQGEDGSFRASLRNTTIALYDPLPGETPCIYEMGIPVVESDMRWHADVAQKVPLNFDRDNVTPAYLRRLRVEITNATSDLMSAADATSTWVKEAMEDDRIDPVALRDVFVKRFGDKAVAADPSDPEANAIAMSRGYTVVHGGSLSKEAWANLRANDLIRPAGQVTPSPSVILSPDGVPPLSAAKLTPGMKAVMAYTVALGSELLGRSVNVDVAPGKITDDWAACYGNGRLMFNLAKLGHRWFNEPNQVRVDALLIHEFGHEVEGDHSSHRFHDAVCTLGAKMRGVTIRVMDFAVEEVSV